MMRQKIGQSIQGKGSIGRKLHPYLWSCHCIATAHFEDGKPMSVNDIYMYPYHRVYHIVTYQALRVESKITYH